MVRRGGSWNAADRLYARVAACKWRFVPYVLKVRVDDTRDQVALNMAADQVGNGSAADYLLWCARYVLRNHKILKDVRAQMRKLDKEDRAQKRGEAAQRKKSEAAWDAARKKC